MSTGKERSEWDKWYPEGTSDVEKLNDLVRETKISFPYARVNAAQQSDGTSLELQEETNVALAESMGFDVPDDLRFRE